MKIVKTKNIYKGFFDLNELTVETKNGDIYSRIVTQRKNAVCALVYNRETKKFILVKQWRPGAQKHIVELVAGVLDEENESEESAISREIIEEVGYRVDYLEFVAKCYLSPGGSTEKISIYVAFVSNKIAKGGGLECEGEYIETVELSLDEVLGNLFEDAKTIIAIEYIKNNHGKLIIEHKNILQNMEQGNR